MLLGLLLIAAMALTAAPASAVETRLYTGTSIGPDGAAGSAGFESLRATAVDQASGEVYAYDLGAGKIYKFDAGGAPVDFSSTGTNSIEGVGGEFITNQLAIAPTGAPAGTAGNIYVATGSTVKIYSPAGALIGEITGDEEVGSRACGVTTDPAGHLFVGFFPNTVQEYTPSANPPVNADQTGQSVAELPFICNLAADGLGNVYASNVIGSSTARLEGLADPSPALIEPGGRALAIDPATNDLYLDRGAEIAVYSSSGDPKSQFDAAGRSEGKGVAIGSTAERAYVANAQTGKVDIYGPSIVLPDVTTEPVTDLTSDSATLNGTVSADDGPEADCEFQYTEENSFNEEGFAGATSVPCSPSGPFTGSGAEAVSAEVDGLSVGGSYFFRLVGNNQNGSNPDLASKTGALGFRTLGPTVVASSATDITTTAATLTGLVKPHEKAFTYRFDYGPTESYGSSVPIPDAASDPLPVGTGNIPPGEVGQRTITDIVMSQGAFAVGQDIVGEGIVAGTTITKIEGSTLTLSRVAELSGSGIPFTSTTVAVSQPIDGLVPDTGYHFRLVATNADAVTFGPDRSFATYPADTGLPDDRAYEMVSPVQKIGEVFVPEPEGSLGGTCLEFCLPGINDITMPMQATADGEALAFEGQPFSPSLAPSGNQYLSQRSSGGWATQSITPPRAATGRGSVSGFKAFSADLSRGVLLQAIPALSPEAPLGEDGMSFNNLYLWEADAPGLRPLVTVEPSKRVAGPPELPGTGENKFELSFAGGNSGTGEEPAFEHLVFEANDALTPAVPGVAPAAPEVGEGRCGGFPGGDCNLYEWVGGQLRLINVLPGNETAATGATIGSGRRLASVLGSNTGPQTQAANVDHAISADGSRIFWSDEGGQVYIRIEGEETVKVQDPGQFLTATPDGSKVLLSDGCLYSVEAESCESLGGSPSSFLGILGASEDLSRIYFVDTEVLAPGAQAGPCEEGIAEGGLGCNLYAYDHGSVDFVAALNFFDNNLGSNNAYGSWKASRSNRTAQVSPDGRYLAFMSYGRPGDAYDNRRADGSNCKYSTIGPLCFEVFEYDLEADSLHCASCNPSGQRPLGLSNLSLIRPAAGGSFPQPENLPAEGEGRLFFESQDVLTAADNNGHIQDVYQWTPPGVGGCGRAAGCIALISSGHSPGDSFFVTSTPTGDDAFFVTREQLLARDKDDQLDVYDARVGGGIAEDLTPPCLGDACRGAATSAPGEAIPGSSTFQAPPKPKPCKKGFVRKHGKCVKKPKRHKQKHKHHKRSAQHKTGGSK